MTTVTEPLDTTTEIVAPDNASLLSAEEDTLPELELIATRHDESDPAAQVVWLDPDSVVPNDINRTFTDAQLADLLASVPVVGFLQPAIVMPHATMPGVYVALIGNRRHAAAKRLGRKLPSIIIEHADQAPQILAIICENEHRLGLRPSEKADLYQQLSLLPGWTEAKIAKAEGVKAAEVKATLALATLPAAARHAADAGQLDLMLSADLNEFVDDPATLAKIIQKGSSPWGFRHAISSAKAKRERDATADKLFAELITAGVKVTKKPKDFPYHSREAAVTDLADTEGNRLDPQQVRTRAGFAAFIDKQSDTTPKVVYYCLDPEKYGFSRLSRSQYVSPEQQAARETEAQAAQAHAEALELAAQVRREFLKTHFGNPRTAKSCQQQALRDVIANPAAISYNTGLAELGDAIAACDILALVDTAGSDRLTRMLVARWVTSAEQNLTRVFARQRWDASPDRARAFLADLLAAGYELSDAEQHEFALLNPPADAAQETDDAADDDEDDEEGDREREDLADEEDEDDEDE